MRRKHNRRDPQITKEFLIAEALSSYDALVLGKTWLTQDPKSVAFSTFVSKALALLEKRDGKKGNAKSGNSNKQHKGGKSKHEAKPWKHVAPKDGEPRIKVLDGKTFHFCHKPHDIEQKPMWYLHKPEDHKDWNPKSTPKEEDIKLEFNDDLKSLLSVLKKDFKWLETWPSNHLKIC